MAARPRMTLTTQLVLQVLLDDPDREMYGLEIRDAVGIASGTVYPILARLERVGWLVGRWEEVDPVKEGRPRRCYYRLEPESLAAVRSAMSRVATATASLRRLRPDLPRGQR